MPTHQAGDLLIFFAANAGGTTVPTVPSGWFTIATHSASGRGAVLAWKTAASASETSGTWTNATSVACWAGRDDVNYLVPGSVSRSNGATTTTVAYAAAMMLGKTGAGEAWFVGFGICNSNSTDFDAAPSGMTNRVSLAGAGASEITAHDTNAVTASWSVTNRTNSSAVSYITFVCEVYDSEIPISAGGGGGYVVGG